MTRTREPTPSPLSDAALDQAAAGAAGRSTADGASNTVLLAQYAINGNSPAKGGNIEYEWKVEEGES